MPARKKKVEETKATEVLPILRYEMKERKFSTHTLQTIVRRNTLIAIMDTNLPNAKLAAEEICRVLNNQEEHTAKSNHGGGTIRKLTKEEVKSQAKQQREAWGLNV